MSIIRVGGEGAEFLAITIHGRSHPASGEFWDGNWVGTTVEVAAGGFRGEVAGDLRAEELAAFHRELVPLRFTHCHRSFAGREYVMRTDVMYSGWATAPILSRAAGETSMDDGRARKRLRLRFGLRGMVVVLLVLAATLAALRPLLRETLGWAERYARVRLNERDLYRHVDDGRLFAERFANAVSSGQFASARQLMTVDARRRLSPSAFAASAGVDALRRGPCEVTKGVLDFSDVQGRFVSEYDLLCGPAGGPRTHVRLVIATESGRLKVDRVEIGEGTPRQP